MKPPLGLFSLERKGRPVAGWPFRFGAALGSQLLVLSASEPFSPGVRITDRSCPPGGRLMFCDQCGMSLQAGAPQCGRCGKMVLGAVELRRSRVREHVRLVGILWMAYSSLYIMAGLGLLVVVKVIFGGLIHIPNGPSPEASIWMRPLFSFMAWLLIAIAATGFFTGWGLLQREAWARPVALVAGFLALLRIPLGTALGIYTLWVLLPSQSDEE